MGWRARCWACPGLFRRRDAETLPAFGPAPLQHEAAVLRAHTYQEAVGAAAPAIVRLKGALHEMSRNLWAEATLQLLLDRDELTMVAKPFRVCQRANGHLSLPRLR